MFSKYKKPGPKPRRFRTANYTDELKLDAKAIQPKAVHVAQSGRQPSVDQFADR